MNPNSAIAKGKQLENFIVEKLRNTGLDPRATRNPGSGSGKIKGDIWNALGLCIEAKNTKKAPGKAEFAQVRREAMGWATEILAWHRPATSLEDTVIMININDFFDLLKKSKERPSVAEPDKDLKWALVGLKNAVSKVQKYIE